MTTIAANVFSIEPRAYEHFTLTASGATTIRNAIVAICIGVMLACLFAYYLRAVPGGFARALLKSGALSPEAAKTPAELGFGKTPFLKRELRDGSFLRRVVRATEGEGEPRYYIDEEDRIRAEVRYDKRGFTLPILVLTLLATAAAGLLLIRLTPALLSLADGLMKG